MRQTDHAEGVLVALRRLNNTTILLTVLIFVIWKYISYFFFTFITPIRQVYNRATSRTSHVCVRTA